VILVEVEVMGFAGFSCIRCFRVDVLLCELEGGEAETLDTTEETIERSTEVYQVSTTKVWQNETQLTLLVEFFQGRVQRPPRVEVRIMQVPSVM
jgi:hypothetical protein